jgi:hypothetical protein
MVQARVQSLTRCYHRAMKTMAIPALILGLSLAPLGASADESFRCGNWIVSSDMTVQELSAKCGAPTSHATETKDVLVRNQNNGLMRKVGETTIETWTYDRGNHAAAMVVTIVDGRIKTIDRQK